MASISTKATALIALHKELQMLHLRPIKKMRFQFDPFHPDAHKLRDFLFHVSSKRIRKTSDICTIGTDIVNDRSEPLLKLLLDNGTEVIFKTSNLSTLEITQEFKKIVERFYVPEVPRTSLVAKRTGFKKKSK